MYWKRWIERWIIGSKHWKIEDTQRQSDKNQPTMYFKLFLLTSKTVFNCQKKIHSFYFELFAFQLKTSTETITINDRRIDSHPKIHFDLNSDKQILFLLTLYCFLSLECVMFSLLAFVSRLNFEHKHFIFPSHEMEKHSVNKF